MFQVWEFFWNWPPGILLLNAQIFNRVRGITWSIDRNMEWSTLEQMSQNGRKIRIPNWKQPLWHFVYRWGYVKDNPNDLFQNNVYTDLKLLWGQLLSLQGKSQDFLFQPDDSAVTGQPLTVDSNGNAEIIHSIGGYFESVQALTGLQVFFNGVLQANPTVAAPGTVAPYLGYVIQSAPTNQAVTVNYNYYYRCQLENDKTDFENFMFQLWVLKELPFMQVRL